MSGTSAADRLLEVEAALKANDRTKAGRVALEGLLVSQEVMWSALQALVDAESRAHGMSGSAFRDVFISRLENAVAALKEAWVSAGTLVLLSHLLRGAATKPSFGMPSADALASIVTREQEVRGVAAASIHYMRVAVATAKDGCTIASAVSQAWDVFSDDNFDQFDATVAAAFDRLGAYLTTLRTALIGIRLY